MVVIIAVIVIFVVANLIAPHIFGWIALAIQSLLRAPAQSVAFWAIIVFFVSMALRHYGRKKK